MIPGPDISSYLAIPELAKRNLTYQLKIDGEPVERIVHLSYEGDGPALVLDCSLPFRVPRSMEGKEITVDLRLGPGLYRRFTGEALTPVGKSFQAASGSYWDPILDEDTSYSEVEPRSVAYGVLSKRDYAGIDVPEPTTPAFSRTGEEELPWITKVSEVLSALEEEAGLTILDDGRNFARGFMSSTLEIPGEPLFRWTTEKHLRGFSHAPRFTERYSEVRIYTTLENGDVVRLARARIDNGHIRPPSGQILTIEISNTDVPNLSKAAREQAYAEALRRGESEEEGDMESVSIDPRVERGDSGVITEVERADAGKWTSVYAVRVAGFSHTLVEDGNDVKEASYSHYAKLLSEDFTEIVDEYVHESVGIPSVEFLEPGALFPSDVLYPSDILFPEG